MKRFLRNNGLSLTLFVLFAISFVGQALAGWRAHAAELQVHGLAPLGFVSYLATGHFIPLFLRTGRANSCRCPYMSF